MHDTDDPDTDGLVDRGAGALIARCRGRSPAPLAVVQAVLQRIAAALNAGFGREGLRIGLQIVGRRGDDRGVLRVARAFAPAGGLAAARPPPLRP